jgi:hypothetical protein
VNPMLLQCAPMLLQCADITLALAATIPQLLLLLLWLHVARWCGAVFASCCFC